MAEFGPINPIQMPNIGQLFLEAQAKRAQINAMQEEAAARKMEQIYRMKKMEMDEQKRQQEQAQMQSILSTAMAPEPVAPPPEIASGMAGPFSAVTGAPPMPRTVFEKMLPAEIGKAPVSEEKGIDKALRAAVRIGNTTLVKQLKSMKDAFPQKKEEAGSVPAATYISIAAQYPKGSKEREDAIIQSGAPASVKQAMAVAPYKAPAQKPWEEYGMTPQEYLNRVHPVARSGGGGSRWFAPVEMTIGGKPTMVQFSSSGEMRKMEGVAPKQTFRERLITDPDLQAKKVEMDAKVEMAKEPKERAKAIEERSVKFGQDYALEPKVKANKILSSQWNNLSSALAEAKKTGKFNAVDQVIGTTFNKFTDPGSVVRESEFARVAAFQALGDKPAGFFASLQSGGSGLSPDERDNLIKTIQAMMDGSNREVAQVQDEFSSMYPPGELNLGIVFRGHGAGTPKRKPIKIIGPTLTGE